MKIRAQYVMVALLLPMTVYSFDWRYTGSLNGERWLEALIVLPQGHVMAIGGDNMDGRALASCEMFDVATETWRVVAPMATARERHTATLLHDGRIVVIGGNTGDIFSYGNQTARVEIFDPATGQWSDGGTILQARQDHTATLLADGTILIVGGWGGDTEQALCEIYDPHTHTCHAAAPLHQKRYDHQAVGLNSGEVLVIGGRIGGSGGIYMPECEVYDPIVNAWRVIDAMHQARVIGELQTFSDGTVLAAGGRNSPNSAATGAEILNTQTMTWQPVAPMLEPCSWGGSIALPLDRFLVAGGMKDANWGSNNSVVATTTCEWYEKELGRWFCAPPLQQARAKHAAVYLHQEVNNHLPELLLLVAGGITGNNTYTATTEYLNFDDDAVAGYKADPVNTVAAVHVTTPTGLNVRVLGNPGPAPVAVLSLAEASNVQLELVSSQGTVVQSIPRFAAGAGETAFTLHVSELSNGVYFLRATTNAGVRTAHVCVVK